MAPEDHLLQLEKCPTGIKGFDEITFGGVPRGRPTLLCGDAGSGKTIFALEFLVRGANEYGEPGVLISFEETAAELASNVASMGFDLNQLCTANKLAVDWVHVNAAEIEEAGEYDLEGLFIRIKSAVDHVGARRVAIDTIEALFSGLKNPSILRSELRRLFRWLKEQGLTALITAERGEGRFTRYGLEEYVADCVISLDHEVANQVSTRHIYVVKYRGSQHGSNKYPFLIGRNGVSVFPITSVGLASPAPTERVPTGLPRLDAMLGRQGFYRGGTVLVTGAAGTGKTSIAAHFVRAACDRGERALFFAFEESREQIIRDMRSIGVDLEPYVACGLLRFHTYRPTMCGLESHLAAVFDIVDEFSPKVVALDPMTDFTAVASGREVKVMFTRLIDFLKVREITAMFTSLSSSEHVSDEPDAGVSSLIDCWLLVRNLEHNGERNRALYVLKARGMGHSNQVREFLLTDEGVDLVEPYVGPEGVLVGSARKAQEMRRAQASVQQHQQVERRQRDLLNRRREVEVQIENLRRQLEEDEREAAIVIDEAKQAEERVTANRDSLARARETGLVSR